MWIRNSLQWATGKPWKMCIWSRTFKGLGQAPQTLASRFTDLASRHHYLHKCFVATLRHIETALWNWVHYDNSPKSRKAHLTYLTSIGLCGSLWLSPHLLLCALLLRALLLRAFLLCTLLLQAFLDLGELTKCRSRVYSRKARTSKACWSKACRSKVRRDPLRPAETPWS